MSTTAFDDQFAPEPPATSVAVPIPQALIAMSRKMRAQDNRCTAEPIYEIRKIKEIPWVEADTAEGWVWLDEGDNLVTTPELIAALDKHVETDGFDRDTEVDDEENETTYIRCYYRSMEVTIDDGAVFFTEDAADDYIRRNQKRHSEKLYVYVDSGHRNPEWQEIRNFLLSLTEKE